MTVKTTTKLADLKNGHWWAFTQEIAKTCEMCGKRFEDIPTVMYYHPELDHGGMQRREHPRWDVLKWLAWWQCPHCEYDFFTVVTEQQVIKWTKAHDPWEEQP